MLNNKLSEEQILDIQNARKFSNETLDFTTNPPTRGPVDPFNRDQISIIPKTDLSFLDTSIRVNPEKTISEMRLSPIVLYNGTIQGAASYKKIVSTNNACDAGCDFGMSWDCNDTNIPEGWTFYQSDDEGVSCGISKFVIVDTGILSNDYCESINEFGTPFSVVFPETTSIDATGIIPSGQIRCSGSYWTT